MRMENRVLGKLLLVAVVALLAACGGSTDGGGTDAGGDGGGGGGTDGGEVTLPPANGKFDYQIGGAYPPSDDVSVLDRDRNDSPIAGKYNVCYVNAFQTQPDEFDWWKANHEDLLLENARGELVEDESWNEILLDTSSVEKRAAILEIVGGWIDACAAKGFQAIEPDNLDSWTRSQGLLSQEHNVELAKLLVARAHAAGLAIAQKNTSELAPLHAAIGFDFAIAEECHWYDECDAYSAAYGALWFEIEYTDSGGAANFQDACDARGDSTSIIYRDRDVAPSSSGDHVYQSC